MKNSVNKAYINKVILIGNVGFIGELKELKPGVTKLPISIATEKPMKNGEVKTTWHNLAVWNKTAVAAEKMLSKGDKVYIEGSIDVNSYENDSGEKVTRTSINVDRLQFLSLEATERPIDQDNVPF